MSVRLPCTEKKKCLKASPERSKGKMEFTANRSNIFRTYTFKKIAGGRRNIIGPFIPSLAFQNYS